LLKHGRAISFQPPFQRADALPEAFGAFAKDGTAFDGASGLPFLTAKSKF